MLLFIELQFFFNLNESQPETSRSVEFVISIPCSREISSPSPPVARANPPDPQTRIKPYKTPLATVPPPRTDPANRPEIDLDSRVTNRRQEAGIRRDVLLLRGRRGAGGRAGAQGGGGAVPPVRRRGGPGGDGEGPQALLRPRLAVAREGPRVPLPRLRPPRAGLPRRGGVGTLAAAAAPGGTVRRVQPRRRPAVPVLPLLWLLPVKRLPLAVATTEQR